ncbi:MAG TPA: hypothetical protein VJM12_07685 [Pyrinomonadaceae bacterium]|nr:hypothetical protein [Pyrinomonadaceae bacterium]
MADNLMREERKQPKIAKEVAIPVDLLEFFQDVHHLIEQRDDSTTIESDDLIQTEFIYGGLTEEGSNHFSFTYFPTAKYSPEMDFGAHCFRNRGYLPRQKENFRLVGMPEYGLRIALLVQ